MDPAGPPLAVTALAIGILHTVLGPDHYVPFVAMARGGNWSLAKTLRITLWCGVAHVAASTALGLVGVISGAALFKLNAVEAVRGDIAGWLLTAFGLMYFVYGVRRALRNRPHAHLHVHADGTVHAHEHSHHGAHLHVHEKSDPGEGRSATTPWILFTIFLFGPCEPLIPLVMYPAARGNPWNVIEVTLIFGAATLATMAATVSAMYLGVEAAPFKRFERFSHAAAGLAVLACGVAVTCGL